MKKMIALLLMTLLCFSLLTGCGAQKEKEGNEAEAPEEIAKVNGDPIYADEFLKWYQSTFSLDMGVDLTNGMPANYLESYEEYKLSYFYYYCQQYALIQSFGKEGYTLDTALVDETIEQVKEQYGSEEAYQSLLKARGFDEESFYQFMSDQVFLSQSFDNYTKDMKPQGDVEDYFVKHKYDYSSLEQRTVRHILVDDLALAVVIIDKLNAGEDFGKLVTEYSKDTGSVPTGGVIGPFDINGSLVESFKEASFKLEKEGDYTLEPVESEYGYHIIILDEIIPAENPVLDGEFKEQVEADMLYSEKQDAFNAHTQEILDNSEFEYAKGWDPMAAYGK